MLFQKNTLKFNSFSKGWIPSTEVFPNGNPNDSATDIVNFDVDSVKGGLVKTNGYAADSVYAASLTGILSNPTGDPHAIKHIHNYSLGIPLQSDLLLAVAYLATADVKYKWIIRDMIVNDAKLSDSTVDRWYNLLLSFDATVTATPSVSAHVNEIEFTIDHTALASEILTGDGFLIPNILDGWIVKSGSNYRTVIFTDDMSVRVTPEFTPTGTITFYRSRLSMLETADFDSIFNPSSEYSAFIVNNIMSKMMIGLGKEVQPLWMGYINKHYFYNKTDSVYLLDNSGISAQRNVILEKRIPEFTGTLDMDFAKNEGKISPETDIEIALTATFDGYQEIVPATLSGGLPDSNINALITVKNVGKSLLFGTTSAGSLTFTPYSCYFDFYVGDTLKLTILFIESQYWSNVLDYFSAVPSWFTNKLAVKIDGFVENGFVERNKIATNLQVAISRGGAGNTGGIDDNYRGSFTWDEFEVKQLIEANADDSKDNSNAILYPSLIIGAKAVGEYATGSEWKITSNVSEFPAFTVSALYQTTLDVENEDTPPNHFLDTKTYFFYNGTTGATIDSVITKLQVPTGFDSIKATITVDPALTNRRITAYNIWGRYSPNTDSEDTTSSWLKPFYLLKRIYVNDTNKDDVNTSDDKTKNPLSNTLGWSVVDNTFQYETYINNIYGTNYANLSDDSEISDALQAELSDLKDIPQLLATLKYEPSVGIAAKYGAATIHNNISWIADTDDKVEVLRFSRVGSTGTNNLDVFSYDFDSSIGFEMIGQDSPGHITALASKDDELIVLRDNSFFSIKTGVETISVKQGGNYVGCKYPRSVVTSRYGVIFADDNGIWLYQGLSSGSMNVIQINWQWDNYYKQTITDKTGMFACWNGQTEEYWLYISGVIYIADFKNMQSLDQSMALMKDKEKVLVPWRKKKFNSMTISDFTIDSYGGLIFADAGAVYFDDLSVFAMAGAAYNELYVDSKIITQYSPMLKVYEVLTETLKDAVNDWKFNIKLFVNDSATARQTIKMFGNCTNQENLICVRPVNIGNAINDISMRVDMGANTGAGDNTSGNGTTVKKLRAFGLNVLTRKEKYVSE